MNSKRRGPGLLRYELQRLEIERNLMAQDIAAEQARWNDFNQRLEELDRRCRRKQCQKTATG